MTDLFDSGVPDADAHRDYVTLRDSTSGNSTFARDRARELWAEFDGHGLADRAFLKDFARNPLDRWWEIHFGCALLEAGIGLRRRERDGPDFYADCGGRRVWYEAKVVEEGDTADAVPAIQPDGRARDVPVDLVRLRIRRGVMSKRDRRRVHVDHGVIGPDDAYVLGLDLKRTSYAHMGDPSVLVRAMFGVDPEWVLDLATETARVRYVDASVIESLNGPVEFKPFRDPSYRWLTAVIGSHVDPWNVGVPLNADFEAVQNPFARRVPRAFLPAARHV